MSMASTSVSKTESPGSSPGAPASQFFGGRVLEKIDGTSLELRRIESV